MNAPDLASAAVSSAIPAATAAAPALQTEGLQLDERQRSMLEAMGIHLWQPGFYKKKQPLAHDGIAQAATKNIAKIAPPALQSAAATPRSSEPEDGWEAAAPRNTAPVQRPAPAAPIKPPASAALPAAAPALLPLPEGIAQMDWQQLQSAVSTCQACALCAGRKNAVFGTGQPSAEPQLAPRADWLIVGEAPSEDEDLQGEPFVGPPGKLLDNMLRAMVINGQPLARQSNVFMASVLKCRPQANRSPGPQELATCQPYLLRQIELLQPKVIVAMGRFAVQALTGSSEPLGKLRGRVHALPGASRSTPVIVTYHPGYLLRNMPDKARAWEDLQLAMQTVQGTPG